MSDEEAFRTRLRATPDDEECRRAFSDWLRDRGRDEEADQHAVAIPGFRAWVLTARRVQPSKAYCPYVATTDLGVTVDIVRSFWLKFNNQRHYLPRDWFERIVMPGKADNVCPAWYIRDDATEDEIVLACALAWTKLPKRRQTQILKAFAQAQEPAHV